MQCFPNIMHTLYEAEIYIFSIAKRVLHIKGQIPKPLLTVSRSLLHEIREAPSEMKRYLTRGQALEPFPVTLGTNIVPSPPVPLGLFDPTHMVPG